MRIIPNKISSVLVMLFTCVFSYAAPGGTPPPPTPPPPPGLPVDGGIMVLLFVSVLYGLYKIYQLNINKKTPV